MYFKFSKFRRYIQLVKENENWQYFIGDQLIDLNHDYLKSPVLYIKKYGIGRQIELSQIKTM